MSHSSKEIPFSVEQVHQLLKSVIGKFIQEAHQYEEYVTNIEPFLSLSSDKHSIEVCTSFSNINGHWVYKKRGEIIDPPKKYGEMLLVKELKGLEIVDVQIEEYVHPLIGPYFKIILKLDKGYSIEMTLDTAALSDKIFSARDGCCILYIIYESKVEIIYWGFKASDNQLSTKLYLEEYE